MLILELQSDPEMKKKTNSTYTGIWELLWYYEHTDNSGDEMDRAVPGGTPAHHIQVSGSCYDNINIQMTMFKIFLE